VLGDCVAFGAPQTFTWRTISAGSPIPRAMHPHQTHFIFGSLGIVGLLFIIIFGTSLSITPAHARTSEYDGNRKALLPATVLSLASLEVLRCGE
jgi:hypothetical protein